MKKNFLLTALALFVLYTGCALVSANSNMLLKSVTINHPQDGDDYKCGGDGHCKTLTNYANAQNPTYTQLLTFLKVDWTDEKLYTDNFVCADFAETLHNNAEKNGIKCAWVGCDFKGGGDGHAFNMFETTDKGKIFIDDTGDNGVAKYEDAIMNVKVGKLLTEKYLFKTGSIDSMGVIKSIEIYC